MQRKTKLNEKKKVVQISPSSSRQTLIPTPKPKPTRNERRKAARAKAKAMILATAPAQNSGSVYKEETTTTKARSKVRKEVLNRELLASLGMQYKRSDNRYLRTLVDPETFVGVRLPDQYARRTGTLQTMINSEAFVFPTNNLVEEPGFYLSILTPCIDRPLLEYVLVEPESILSAVKAAVSVQTPDYGLHPVEPTTRCLAEETSQLILSEGYFNVVAPWWIEGNSSQSISAPPFKGLDSDGQRFYGHPILLDSDNDGGFVVTVNFAIARAATGVSTATITLVSEAGAVTKALNTVAGSHAATVSFSDVDMGAVLTPTSVATVSSCGLPGVGVRITNPVGPTGLATQTIVSIEWRCICGTDLPLPQMRLIALPDVETFTSKVDQYRPISASVWMEYEGADLTNGGQAAAIMYRGGRPFGINGLWDYDQVAQTPGGYQGALKLGSYSYWLPSSNNDTMMREIHAVSDWSLPYVVNVGIVSSPDIPHTLRYRIPINFEIISTAQFFTYDVAEDHQEWIHDAAHKLRGAKTSMENPGHGGFIQDLIGGGIDFGAGLLKGVAGMLPF